MAGRQGWLPLQAYMVLSDPMARLKYNAQLDQALQDQEDDYTGGQQRELTSSA